MALLLSAGLSGCVDPIDLGLGRQQKQLVVDGLVTDGPGPHTVKLTYSAAYEQNFAGLTENVKGATVRIEDDQGHVVLLYEVQPGIYRTAVGALEGTVGRTYTLYVTTPEGEKYRSHPAPMRPVAEIDSFYTELGTRGELSNGVTTEHEGVQTYIDFRDPAGQANYYRWRWDATFEARAKQGFYVSQCWAPKEVVSTPNVGSDVLFDGNRVTQKSISFHPFGIKLIWNYSPKVEQLSLTEEAYEFWQQVQQQKEQAGSPFDAPPDPIRGNVENVNDPKKPALGYFGASAVSSKRTCFKASDYPSRSPIPPVDIPEGACRTAYPGSSRYPPPYWSSTCTQ